MFKVNIEKEKTRTYFVFDAGELYQPIQLIGNYMCFDKQEYEIDRVIGLEKSIAIIIKNKLPVVILDKDYDEYIKRTTGAFATFEFMPVTPISKDAYNTLHALYEIQYQDTEDYAIDQAIEGDIKEASKQLSKHRGPFRTF